MKTKVKTQAGYIIMLKSMAGIFKMVDLLPPQNEEIRLKGHSNNIVVPQKVKIVPPLVGIHCYMSY